MKKFVTVLALISVPLMMSCGVKSTKSAELSDSRTMQRVSGTYEGRDFTVTLTPNYATLVWDDGTQGFTALEKPWAPGEARPRCICSRFVHGESSILVEFSVMQQPIKVTYTRESAQVVNSVRGNYLGIGFTANFNADRSLVTIAWDDGVAGVALSYSPSPVARDRCLNNCRTYKQPSDIHFLFATHDENNKIISVEYALYSDLFGNL